MKRFVWVILASLLLVGCGERQAGSLECYLVATGAPLGRDLLALAQSETYFSIYGADLYGYATAFGSLEALLPLFEVELPDAQVLSAEELAGLTG